MHDVAIIGAGISGCTAAIYAARKKMNYLFVTKEFGGQFFESGKILNYPGITETDGAKFSKSFEEQLEFNKIELKEGEEIGEVKSVKGGFELAGKKDKYKAKSVIVATGSKPKRLDVPGEKEYANKGVTYCSICDGPLFKDKTIAIIGGGNSALEGVDFTKDIAKKIYLVNIQKEFSAHESLIEKAQSIEKVEVILEAKTTEVYGDKMVKGIKYEKGGKTEELDVEGIIVEIGRVPNTRFLEGFLELDEDGHVAIDCQGRTSAEGVFAAGDCASGHEYQYAIAAGQGCIALLKAARYLAGKK
jgi:thioredoxin reductase